VTRAGVPPASELWRWLLPLLAALVLAESLLGNWTLRRGARLA
jgi:hypothetical protein